jgi:hypothetical protein
MPDNKTLPPTGTGTADIVVATDSIGGVEYQRVKLSLGADGTAADAPVGAGTESGVLRVTLPTDGTGVIDKIATSVVPGVAATNLGKAEDAASVSGDTGVFVLATRQDAPAQSAGTAGDYSSLVNNSRGQLHVAEVGADTITTQQVNATNAAATLVGANTKRRYVTILNRQLASVFIGPATVTTGVGFELLPGAAITLLTTALIQGITAAASGASEYCHVIQVIDT